MEALHEVRELAEDVRHVADELGASEELHVEHMDAADEIVVGVTAANADPDPLKVLQLAGEEGLSVVLIV